MSVIHNLYTVTFCTNTFQGVIVNCRNPLANPKGTCWEAQWWAWDQKGRGYACTSTPSDRPDAPSCKRGGTVLQATSRPNKKEGRRERREGWEGVPGPGMSRPLLLQPGLHSYHLLPHGLQYLTLARLQVSPPFSPRLTTQTRLDRVSHAANPPSPQAGYVRKHKRYNHEYAGVTCPGQPCHAPHNV